MIYTHAAAALISASIAATGAWRIQDWRFDAKEKTHAEQKLVQVQQSAAADIRRMDNTIQAQRIATSRAVALRRDRDSALTELGRLRLAVNSAVPSTCDASTTGAIPASSGNQLLLKCAQELTDLAGIADRHASDVKTLIEAWPQ